jgi:hypothetical protein
VDGKANGQWSAMGFGTNQAFIHQLTDNAACVSCTLTLHSHDGPHLPSWNFTLQEKRFQELSRAGINRVNGAFVFISVSDVALYPGIDAVQGEDVVHKFNLIQADFQKVDAIIRKIGLIKALAIAGRTIGRLQIGHIPLPIP